MQRIFKWVGIFLAGVVVLVAAAAAYVYAASEYAMRRQYDIPLTPFTAATDAEAIARGKRVAILSGCYAGCHGQTLEGNPALFDLPNVARIAAPNVTEKLREYTDPELMRLLRHGLKRDGTTTWVMPVPMFSQLSERDVEDLVAFLRSEPVRQGPSGEFEVLPLGRLGIVLGKLQPIVAQVDHARPRIAMADRSDPLAYGKYLVHTTCVECHGQSLEGSEIAHAPNLAIVQAYSEGDFFRLMRTGRGLGDRKLGLMAEVAEVRFKLFTDEEVRAVRNYLLHRMQADAALAASR